MRYRKSLDVCRLMVPENPPPSRGGIEAGLRGAQNRGPGCYGPTPVSIMYH